jgi:hypothetical protein
MTPTQTAIAAALISSSVLTVGIEFIGDKIFARIRYRGWQAVFLANSQVYFGKISSVTRNDIRLTNIYYLQSNKQGSNAGYPRDIDTDDVTLVKLGEELHGPEDMMTIGRAHIVFTETLKDTAQVVKAIKTFEKDNK